MTPNAYGIFATTIASSRDHGIDRLRGIVRTDDQAARIVDAAALTVAMRTGEPVEIVAAAIRSNAAHCYVRCRDAVKLVWAALAEVNAAFTTTHRLHGAGEGFESAAPIHDCRDGGEMAEALLLAA